MEFDGGRAAPVQQKIFTGLRSAKGLVGQVPIDVGSTQCCRGTTSARSCSWSICRAFLF
jgi:hypothetical protein